MMDYEVVLVGGCREERSSFFLILTTLLGLTSIESILPGHS